MSEIYRDRSEGTAAKRQELLRRRREELVTMPHAVRRVVVARTARIAASMVATLSGVALIAAAYSPNLAGRMSSVMPGIQPAPLSTLLSGAWLLGLVAWAISRARVEHRFAVAMSKYVLPTNDLDHDVERLDHERPDDIARSMGHDLEVRSAAWVVLAAGVVLPATALWFARILRTRGWPVMSEFEASLALHAKALALIGVAGAFGAVMMTRKTLRQPFVATLALPFGVVAGGLTVAGFVKQTPYAWVVCGLAVVTFSIGWIARTLRKERALLEVEDPAAGSELFTIRGMIRQIRTSLATVKSSLGFVKRKYWLFGGFVVAVSLIVSGIGLFVSTHHATAYPPPGQVQATLPQSQLLPLAPPSPSDAPTPYKVEREGNHFRVQATLDAKGELVVPMVGFATVPQNWEAALDISLVSAGPIGIVTEEGTKYLSTANPETRILIEACSSARPLSVHLQQAHTPGAKVVLFVSPRLGVANCN
jgi:hypothetical protein